MINRSSRLLLPIAVLAPLFAVQAAQAQASRAVYMVTTTCTALEGSTIPIPDQAPEQRRATTANLDQRALSVGSELGFSPDRVEGDIQRWRDDILTRMHDPDPDKSKRSRDQIAQLVRLCPTLLGSRLLDTLGQVH